MKALMGWTGSDGQRPEVKLALMRAQSAALSRQIPLLYSILTVDAASACFTFAGKAPWQWAILFPAILILGCTIRMVIWIRRRDDNASGATLERRFVGTTVLAVVLAILFVIWTLVLYQYGDAEMRGQVAGTFGITAICCIYCFCRA